MQVIHNLGILSMNRNVSENAGFLLANKRGSYCCFFNAPASRYQGLFYYDEKSMNMFKFIENIEIIDHGDVAQLKNGFYFAERRRDDVIESFLMPKGFNSLIYEISPKNEIDLILDCKDSYDNREWGRNYEIFEEKDCIIVKFAKKTDKREDKSDGMEEFALYLAVKGDEKEYLKNDRWVERRYSYDEERNSPPFTRHVYNALRLKGSKFVFSMSKNRNDAIKECEHVFNNIDGLKNKEKEYFFDMLKNEPIKKLITDEKINKEIKIAYINALNSLNNLVVDGKNNYGVVAGLPWFFQFWARDSLVSLKALSKID
ncbi:hypothetical protein HYX03_02060, partial [Candidatus Woesearchaeota archaeon]|nr:hypothetical protein [Candidatus Woesearchaeota archaeon]